MKLEFDQASATYLIRSYRPGVIVVNDMELTTSCIITPHTLVRDWQPRSLPELQSKDLWAITDLHPDIILLGTGERLRFPDPGLITPLMEQQIGVEIMDTAAACRGYSVLIAEQRSVAAALIIDQIGTDID